MNRIVGITLILFLGLFVLPTAVDSADQWIHIKELKPLFFSLPKESNFVKTHKYFWYCGLDDRKITFLVGMSENPIELSLLNSKNIAPGQILDGGYSTAYMVLQRKNRFIGGQPAATVTTLIYDFLKKKHFIWTGLLVRLPDGISNRDGLYSIGCITKGCDTSEQAQKIIEANEVIINEFYEHVRFNRQ